MPAGDGPSPRWAAIYLMTPLGRTGSLVAASFAILGKMASSIAMRLEKTKKMPRKRLKKSHSCWLISWLDSRFRCLWRV